MNYLLMMSLFLCASCQQKSHHDIGIKQNATNQKLTNEYLEAKNPGVLALDEPLSQFVRRIFEDSNGNLWLGTQGDGVIQHNGDSLKYHSIEEGFAGYVVRGILEDKEGNIWFGTERGLSKYDGSSFSNYFKEDGLISNDIWSIYLDNNGIIWVGTLDGLCYFNPLQLQSNSPEMQFTNFDIPSSPPDPTRGVTSEHIIHSIMEDSKGRMWFGTNGGAYIYDGKTLSNLSVKDGMCDNNVNSILEDANGHFWFATHHKGVCVWDGSTFIRSTIDEGIKGFEAWDLYQDKNGDIWFPIEREGLYKFDGQSFTNYFKKQGLSSSAIQCTFMDKSGRLWAGGWQGLFSFDGQSFYPVTKQGPWQGC